MILTSTLIRLPYSSRGSGVMVERLTKLEFILWHQWQLISIDPADSLLELAPLTARLDALINAILRAPVRVELIPR